MDFGQEQQSPPPNSDVNENPSNNESGLIENADTTQETNIQQTVENLLTKYRKDLDEFASTINIYASSSTPLVETKLDELSDQCFREIEDKIRQGQKGPKFQFRTHIFNSIQQANDDFNRSIQSSQQDYSSCLDSLRQKLKDATVESVSQIVNWGAASKLDRISSAVLDKHGRTIKLKPKELIHTMLEEDTKNFRTSMNLLEEALTDYRSAVTQGFETHRFMSSQQLREFHERAQTDAHVKLKSSSSFFTDHLTDGIKQLFDVFVAMNQRIKAHEKSLIAELSQNDVRILHCYKNIMKRTYYSYLYPNLENLSVTNTSQGSHASSDILKSTQMVSYAHRQTQSLQRNQTKTLQIPDTTSPQNNGENSPGTFERNRHSYEHKQRFDHLIQAELTTLKGRFAAELVETPPESRKQLVERYVKDFQQFLDALLPCDSESKIRMLEKDLTLSLKVFLLKQKPRTPKTATIPAPVIEEDKMDCTPPPPNPIECGSQNNQKEKQESNSEPMDTMAADIIEKIQKRLKIYRKDLDDFMKRINMYAPSSTQTVEKKLEELGSLCCQQIVEGICPDGENSDSSGQFYDHVVKCILKINGDFTHRLQSAREGYEYESCLKSLHGKLEDAAKRMTSAIVNGQNGSCSSTSKYYEVLKNHMYTVQQKPSDLIQKMLKDDTKEFFTAMTFLEEALVMYRRQMAKYLEMYKCMSDKLLLDFHLQAHKDAQAKMKSDSSFFRAQFANGIKQMYDAFTSTNQQIAATEHKLVLHIVENELRIKNFYNDMMKEFTKATLWTPSQLKQLHEDVVEEICVAFKLACNFHPGSGMDFTTYRNLICTQLNPLIETFQQQNVRKGDKLLSSVSRAINDHKRNYNYKMEECLKKAGGTMNSQEFERHHTTTLSDVCNSLEFELQKMVGLVDHSSHITTLKKEIDADWDDFQEGNEKKLKLTKPKEWEIQRSKKSKEAAMKLKAQAEERQQREQKLIATKSSATPPSVVTPSRIINNALEEATQNYHQEMEKHYKNNEFTRPADLEALHDRLTAEAITKYEATTPLSSIQKNDLKSALQLTYQQYKEQNDMNVPVDPAIGIDLGTTYSCAAVYLNLNGAVKIIPNGKGSNITPSYVCYNDMGYMEMVGQTAKSKAYENAENTIYDAKRILGKDFTDSKLQKDMTFWPFQVVEEQKVPKIKINSGKTFYPEQVSSEVLKELRKDAERFLGCEVTKAVITVPAYFTDGQRQATIDAGKLAGLEVLKILNEPTSAAIAYNLQHSEDNFCHVLVYDLGGGTFDVAVLKISNGKIETLAVDGDTHLGGQDFDQRVMEHCCLEFQTVEGIDLIEGKDSTNATERNEARGRLHRLQQACEGARKELLSCRETNIDVAAIYNKHGQSFDLKVALSRNKFEELNEELFVKTLEFVEKVLASAQLDKSKIEDVVLVGGSTRIPKVQEVLQGYFEGKALSKRINPDEVVAYGAAIKAAILNGKNKCNKSNSVIKTRSKISKS